MKTIIGVILLVLLTPLWIVLYLVAWFSILANSLFELFYDPIYKLAGKPLDRG